MHGTKRCAGGLEAVGSTPMIELPSISPSDGAKIVAKWEGANPTGSLKDRMALAMIRKARAKGELVDDDPVVEFTGGSTGSSLALVCAVLGHPLHLVTADCISPEKIASMRALGAEVEVLETPDGTSYDGLFDDLRRRALELRDETGAYFTDQFNNSDQLEGYRALGEEILEQRPDVGAFVMSVGTGGCAMGTSSAFRERRADVSVVLVEPAESPVLSAERTGSHRVQGTAIVGTPPLVEDELYDAVETVPTDEAVECVRRLASDEGLLAGTSTGLNVRGAQKLAADMDPDDVVVTIACDTGLKYLSGSAYDEGDDSTFNVC